MRCLTSPLTLSGILTGSMREVPLVGVLETAPQGNLMAPAQLAQAARGHELARRAIRSRGIGPHATLKAHDVCDEPRQLENGDVLAAAHIHMLEF